MKKTIILIAVIAVIFGACQENTLSLETQKQQFINDNDYLGSLYLVDAYQKIKLDESVSEVRKSELKHLRDTQLTIKLIALSKRYENLDVLLTGLDDQDFVLVEKNLNAYVAERLVQEEYSDRVAEFKRAGKTEDSNACGGSCPDLGAETSAISCTIGCGSSYLYCLNYNPGGTFCEDQLDYCSGSCCSKFCAINEQ